MKTKLRIKFKNGAPRMLKSWEKLFFQEVERREKAERRYEILRDLVERSSGPMVALTELLNPRKILELTRPENPDYEYEVVEVKSKRGQK